jgi:tetratricopeptide (TPR) repeat protein
MHLRGVELRPVLKTLLVRAQEALGRGDLTTARALSSEALTSAPDDVNALQLAGYVGYKSGRLDEAIGLFMRALAKAPSSPSLRFHLGNTQRAAGLLDEAVANYRALLGADPKHADAAYNLGLCLVDLGSDEDAARAFVQAGRSDPDLLDARQQLIECAARLARNGRQPPARPTPPARDHDGRSDFLSIVTCSIDPAKFARFEASVARHFASSTWELIRIDDARSLSEGYTRGAAGARGERIVLCHDDVEILAPDFQARLLDCLDRYDVVGVAGSTLAAGPSVFWSGSAHAHGWVTHRDADGNLRPSTLNVEGPVVEHAQTLDGVFIATHRRVLDLIPFDAEILDGFHGYDLDFSYRAHLAGLRVSICLDLLLVHDSMGNFGASFRKYAERLRAKHPALSRPEPREAPFFQAGSSSAAQTVVLYRWLGALIERSAG